MVALVLPFLPANPIQIHNESVRVCKCVESALDLGKSALCCVSVVDVVLLVVAQSRASTTTVLV